MGLTAWRQWIVAVVTLGLLGYGAYLHDRIMDGLAIVCAAAACSTIEMDVNMLGLFIFPAAFGMAGFLVLAWRGTSNGSRK